MSRMKVTISWHLIYFISISTLLLITLAGIVLRAALYA